jgi:hypothetical protein
MRSLFRTLKVAFPFLSMALVVAACEATMPPGPVNVPVPPPSGKAQLDDADIQAAKVPLKEAIEACIVKYQDDGKAEAMLTVDPTGNVTDVSVHHLLNITQKKCLARAARAAKFPAFTGPAMKVVWSMTKAPPPPPATPPPAK